MKVEIEYRITEKDYVKAVKLAAVATKKQLIWLSLLGFLLLFCVIFGNHSLRFMGIFAMIFGFIGYFLTLYVISPMMAKYQYRKYKLLHQPLRFKLMDTGYLMKNESGEVRVKWSDLIRWRQNKDFILLYFAPRLFHMIPKTTVGIQLNVIDIERELTKKVGSAT